MLLKPALPEMIATLRRFAIAESPSLEKEPADRCCEIIAAEWRRQGLKVERIAQKHRGDHLRFVSEPQASTKAKKQLLVLGHYDTVYASGTLEKMPFRITGGKAYGPGVFDMKAGIVQALFAHQALQKLNISVKKRLVFLWTSDEEIGSQSSQKLIEEEARRSDAVFVLEPSFGPRGLLKTQRKGVGEAEIIVHGRASHAGLAPEEGVNAIHELCNQLSRVLKWNEPKRGTSVNADVVEGGTRANVIAERRARGARSPGHANFRHAHVGAAAAGAEAAASRRATGSSRRVFPRAARTQNERGVIRARAIAGR